MPDRVTTQLDAANSLIADLRQVAVGIKTLADEAQGGLADAAERLEHAELQASEAEVRAEFLKNRLDKWCDLLMDFRRGVRDRDELIERTVGRYGCDYADADAGANPGATTGGAPSGQ